MADSTDGSTMPDQTFTTDHEREAYRLGVEAAVAAASWVLDGNMSQDHIARMVAWLDDGDPRADEFLPAMPDLSGEWADAPTPDSLYREIIGEPLLVANDAAVRDEIADAWEAGVSDTFGPECERILRGALEDTSEEPCTEHGFDVCPDCGNGGTKIDASGYVPCTRFLTCWADLDDGTEG
jgi:hypothetical protein